MKKSTTKASPLKPTKKASARVPVPWEKIRRLYESGASYDTIARQTDPRYSEVRPDPTHSTRAKLSRFMSVGIMIGGKMVRLKPRSRKELNKQNAAKKSVAKFRPKKTKKQVKSSSAVPKSTPPLEEPSTETTE